MGMRVLSEPKASLHRDSARTVARKAAMHRFEQRANGALRIVMSARPPARSGTRDIQRPYGPLFNKPRNLSCRLWLCRPRRIDHEMRPTVLHAKQESQAGAPRQVSGGKDDRCIAVHDILAGARAITSAVQGRERVYTWDRPVLRGAIRRTPATCREAPSPGPHPARRGPRRSGRRR